MFAVLIYTVPREAKDPFALLSRMTFLPVVTPYMQSTSQWQLWNLFAPNPLQVVTAYQLDVDRGHGWEFLTVMRPGTYPWWRNATYYKLFGNILDMNDRSKDHVKIRFVQLQCDTFHLPAATPIRLTYSYYTVPDPGSPQSIAWWRSFVPQWQTVEGLETTCPTPTL